MNKIENGFSPEHQFSHDTIVGAAQRKMDSLTTLSYAEQLDTMGQLKNPFEKLMEQTE